jgi:hypothetical protein
VLFDGQHELKQGADDVPQRTIYIVIAFVAHELTFRFNESSEQPRHTNEHGGRNGSD